MIKTGANKKPQTRAWPEALLGWLRALPLVAVPMLFLACHVSSKELPMYTADQLQPVCVGRAMLSLPQPASVSYSKSIVSDVTVEWHALSPGGFPATWQAYLLGPAYANHKIDRQSANAQHAETVSHTTLNPNPSFKTWVSMTLVGDHVLLLKADFSNDQDSIARESLQMTESGFRAGNSSSSNGFCVSGGSIAGNTYGESSDAKISVKASPFGDTPVLIDLSTDEVSKPGTPSLFTRTGSATQKLTQLTGGVKTIRHHDRKVAGQMGQEVATLQQGSSGFGINAQYEFIGLANRRDAPYFHLTLDGEFPASITPEQVLLVWDQALNSMTFAK